MYVALHPKEFECSNCSEQQRRYKGCKTTGKGAGYQINDTIIRRCLLKLVHPMIFQWLRMYKHYKNNILYTTGGVSQQPCKYLDIMNIVDSLYNEQASDG